MKGIAIVYPSDTIVLGEKRHDAGDFYMDLLEDGGNDFTGIAEQGRHSNNGVTSNQSKGTGSWAAPIMPWPTAARGLSNFHNRLIL